jgi:23S rRNA (cytidine1920-2'-O)/16S rRNA (cytidine1409-2'-O)-methyltransferase
VDVGHGQLRSSLRQDPRVINLERTNLADLNSATAPEPIGLISIDLSYLSIASACHNSTRSRSSPSQT